jgi:glycine/D-amino acid oxidase-like deaminating enzyme
MPAAPPGKVGTQVLSSLPTGPDTDERLGPLQEEPPPAAHPVLIDFENGLYARCDSLQNRTRVGNMNIAADETVVDPDRLDERVSERFRRWARDTIEDRMPVYRDCEDLESLAGIYTLTPDDQAIIGELPGVSGLYVVSGFSGHGFKLAPSIGEGVAQLVTGEPVSAFDPEFFSPTRFANQRVSTGRGFGL